MGLLWGGVLVVLFTSGALNVLINLPILVLQRAISNLVVYLNWWLGVIFVGLGLAFAESIRAIQKYSGLLADSQDAAGDVGLAGGRGLVDPAFKYQLSLFRAERNAYLSSFAVVMLLVLWRFAIIVRANIRLSERRERDR